MLRSLFPRACCRFLSLPLLGAVADGFDDWLAANGYTRVALCGLSHNHRRRQTAIPLILTSHMTS